MRNTKIIATLGPASQDEFTIHNLVKTGIDVVRLNFSHGSHEEYAVVIKRVNKVARDLNRPILILQDLQGPKIRTGEMENGEIQLIPDQNITVTCENVQGNQKIISVDYPDICKNLIPGNHILLDDGKLDLVVTSVAKNHAEARVLVGGPLRSHKGVNIPGGNLAISGFTEKDKADLEFGLKMGIDAVAISFVRQAEDINRVKTAIQQMFPSCRSIPLIAKLERPEALKNLEQILDIADGVMVARGDLGVEMSPESVPIAQKQIIEAANRKGKVVITATQMLDSMIFEPRPTRAEASDVANAIFDGTDAVMLSGETASGKYPVKAVEMMDAIICLAEQYNAKWSRWRGEIKPRSSDDDTYFMAMAARELAHDRNVAAIAVFTKSGRTALLLSKIRPAVPILAFTTEPNTFHRMNIYWGVTPYKVKHVESIDQMLSVVETTLLNAHAIQPGQQVVLICGFPIGEVRPTNLALLHTVGQK
jgi:pyruvate kinase